MSDGEDDVDVEMREVEEKAEAEERAAISSQIMQIADSSSPTLLTPNLRRSHSILSFKPHHHQLTRSLSLPTFMAENGAHGLWIVVCGAGR